MKILDLFAGIGGFSLAAHWMGWETAAFVEWDKDCQALLNLRFPKTKIYGDIKEFNGGGYRGSIDIVTGGFPCQPYSIAGKRKGKEDDRDQWGEMLRVVEEVRPPWFVAENVSNILNMGFDSFITDLESIGYEAVTFCISSDAVGLQTMERHVWIIAASHEIGFKRKWERQIQGIKEVSGQLQGSDKGRLQRWDISKSRFRRVRERVSRRLDRSSKKRLEMLGNAVPPQVVYEIFKIIDEFDRL